MATGSISKVTNDTGNNYCKMPDGTLMCWGTSNFPATSTGDQDVTINFPASFISAPVLSLSWRDTAAVNNYMSMLSSREHNLTYAIVVAKRLQASYAWNFQWIAIGRWK